MCSASLREAECGGEGGGGAEEMGETAKGRREWKNNKDRWEKATECTAGTGKASKGGNSGDG